MNRTRRSVQHEVEIFGYRTNPLQRATQQSCEVRAKARLVKSSAFEGSFVIARQDPGFIRDARCKRTQRQVVALRFDDALRLSLLLLNDVAEHATLLADEVLAPRPQLVKHSPRYEHSRSQLRSGMAEFLARILAIILEQADVLDAGIALQIENSFGTQPSKVPDFIVVGIP